MSALSREEFLASCKEIGEETNLLVLEYTVSCYVAYL